MFGDEGGIKDAARRPGTAVDDVYDELTPPTSGDSITDKVDDLSRGRRYAPEMDEITGAIEDLLELILG